MISILKFDTENFDKKMIKLIGGDIEQQQDNEAMKMKNFIFFIIVSVTESKLHGDNVLPCLKYSSMLLRNSFDDDWFNCTFDGIV